MNTRYYPVLFLILSFIPSAFAHQDAMNDGHPDNVGKVDFQANCHEDVRAGVDHALAMMHHMMYTQARAEFSTITQADPNCAMAHWGVATSLFQPLWGTTPSAEDIATGRIAIQQASSLAKDERERLLIDATAAFFEPDTDRVGDRLAGWVKGMEQAYQAFPDDTNVASLYALSRLTLARSDDNRKALHNEAEKVLRDVWKTEPRHPGAVHYSIHATDADGRAGNATEIVNSYTGIAPNVPHALHMPSHIYVRLGDWPQMIDWNQKSSGVAVEHKINGATSFHYIHALDYLVYGHLQRGEDSAARRVWESAQANGPHQANFPGAFHLASIPARLAIETRDWKAAAALTPRAVDYINWDKFAWPEALSWYARGLGAVHTGDLEGAREAEQRLKTLAEAARAAADQRFSTYIEVDRRILAGWIAKAKGEPDRAIELMDSAGQLEATVEKHPVSPGTLKPPYEALGDLLFVLNRPTEALVAYGRSDQTWPNRYQTLEGAARSADLAGDTETAGRWSRRLLQIAPQTERAPIERTQNLAGRG